MESLGEITNFLAISPSLGTAGMPTRQQFPLIAAAGYEVVINLSRLESPGQQPDEKDMVEALGLDYIHIPVAWENPQQTDLARFFQALDEHRERRVFVHCVLNYRVSAFMYLYRTQRLGVPPEQAWEDLVQIWEPEGVWETFIQSARLGFQGD